MHRRTVSSKPCLAALLVSLALGSPRVARASEWTATDTAFEAGVVALVATDVAQTRWFLSHRPKAFETNPLLGRHPSDAKLLAFSAVGVASHALVSLALPQPYRRLWQLAGAGLEIDAVASNARTFGFHVMF
jgi:hypothetical protein